MKLLKPNHPHLHTKIETFDFNNPPEDPVEIAEKLKTALGDWKGVGLSANQIGLPYRVFAINTDPVMICFNPKITYYSEESAVMNETCLTFPLLFVRIRRSEIIRARFVDEHNEIRTHGFDGVVSRAFQHEIDHLDGNMYLTRASKYNLEKAKHKTKMIKRKLKKQDKLIKSLQGTIHGN